jgi:phosphohistidine phosphatase
VDFKTGSMALFEYDPYSGNEGSASLVLYLHPKAALFMK